MIAGFFKTSILFKLHSILHLKYYNHLFYPKYYSISIIVSKYRVVYHMLVLLNDLIVGGISETSFRPQRVLQIKIFI